MRCTSFCSAESYRIDEFAKFLRSEGYEPKFYDDVIHIEVPSANSDSSSDAFYFPYGCLVAWNMSEEQEIQMLELSEGFQKKIGQILFKDVSFYSINPLLEDMIDIDEEEDHMMLPSADPFVKLALSHAFSQSVKLRSFEQSISLTIEKTRHLPDELAQKGRIPLSSQKLAKLMGELFAQRDSMNLDSDILDIPEFFWRRPKYEPIYEKASSYLDIQARVAILNRKLDRVYELYGVLSEEHKHLHSTRLEIVIILLIMVEVIFSVFRDWDLVAQVWKFFA